VIATASMPWDASPRARRRLIVALALSLGAHAAVWNWARLPSVRLELPEPTLEVAIVPKPAPAPLEAVPVPEVVQTPPAPMKPAPHPRKAPEPRVAATPEPTPTPARAEVPTREPVMTARTESQGPIEFTIPPPVAPPVAKPVEPLAPSPDALAGYGRSVSQALARHREYPRLALMRGWEGSTTLRLRVAPGGKLAEAAVHQSSGHDVLDDQALAMVKRLGALPPPPEALRDREFAVLVPVVFQLAK
jgi:protein TonB